MGANIVNEKLLGNGKIFYCPAFQSDTNHDFDAANTNPWGPSNPFYDGSSTPKHGCRISYSQRPILYPQIPTTGGRLIVTKVQYDKGSTRWEPQQVPRSWPTGSTTLQPRYEFPKLARLKGAALFSDINSGEGRLKVGHKKGLNVLYNTGAAKWVQDSFGFNFGPGFDQSIGELIKNETGYGAGFDVTQIQIWMALDMQ